MASTPIVSSLCIVHGCVLVLHGDTRDPLEPKQKAVCNISVTTRVLSIITILHYILGVSWYLDNTVSLKAYQDAAAHSAYMYVP